MGYTWASEEETPMSWKETCVMDERLLLVARYREGRLPMTELCRQAGVSRKTAYKWLQRFAADGAAGLVNRSRAPHVQARQTPKDVAEQVVTFKRKHRSWGPKKLVAALRKLEPKVAWPAPSTVSEILDAHGLVKRRKRRLKTPRYPHPLLACEAPNEVWTADFKGQFKTGNGVYCAGSSSASTDGAKSSTRSAPMRRSTYDRPPTFTGSLGGGIPLRCRR
jgi:transposase-like protein